MSLVQTDRAAYEALFAFWRDAGVDHGYDDLPIDRTYQPPRPDPRQKPELKLVSRTSDARIDPALALEQARLLAAQATSLDMLRSTIRQFDLHPLHALGAKTAHFWHSLTTTGPVNDPVLVVTGPHALTTSSHSAQPGADLDPTNAPGPAQRLLEKMLRASGLFDRAVLTSCLFCATPGGRSPTNEELEINLPFLERLIHLLCPRLVLVMGQDAILTLTGQTGSILTLRGQTFSLRARHGEAFRKPINAKALLDPNFILAKPVAKQKTWLDLLEVLDPLDA